MKKGFHIIFLLGLTNSRVLAQIDAGQYKPYQMSVEFFKTDGRPFVNGAYDVEGSPFYVDDWKPADAILAGNQQIAHAQMRLNLQTQEMHFLDREGKEMALPAGLVKEVRFKGLVAGKDSALTIFRCGLPAVDQQNAASFYELLADGRMQLLCARSKAISTDKNPSSGEVHKEFVLYEEFYLFDGKEMRRVKKDKEFILNALSDKAAAIEEFVEQNRLHLKNIGEFKKTIDYYNSLK